MTKTFRQMPQIEVVVHTCHMQGTKKVENVRWEVCNELPRWCRVLGQYLLTRTHIYFIHKINVHTTTGVPLVI